MKILRASLLGLFAMLAPSLAEAQPSYDSYRAPASRNSGGTARDPASVFTPRDPQRGRADSNSQYLRAPAPVREPPPPLVPRPAPAGPDGGSQPWRR